MDPFLRGIAAGWVKVELAQHVARGIERLRRVAAVVGNVRGEHAGLVLEPLARQMARAAAAARAAAVANVLVARDQVEPTRLSVTGLADTEPRVENTSAENRARNRRVEIIIDLSGPIEEQEMRLRELMNPEADVSAAPDSRSSDDSDQDELLW